MNNYTAQKSNDETVSKKGNNMDRHAKFKKDLADAKPYQEEAGRRLELAFHLDELDTDCDQHGKNYDIEGIRPNGDLLTAEVKHDIISDNLANVVIEYECDGKPSGISTTKAFWWIQVIEGQYYIITVEAIKRMIQYNMHFDSRPAGDNKTARIHLFKKRMFIDNCRIINQYGMIKNT